MGREKEIGVDLTGGYGRVGLRTVCAISVCLSLVLFGSVATALSVAQQTRPAPSAAPGPGSPAIIGPSNPAPTVRSFSHAVATKAPSQSAIGSVYRHIDPVIHGGPASLAAPFSMSAAGSPLAFSSPMECHDDRYGQVPCTPPLRYHGGPVQHHPLIVLIFWGPKWYQDHNGIIAAELALFRALGNQNPANLAHYSMGILAQDCDSGGCPASNVSLFQNQAFIDNTAPPYIDSNGDAAVNEINSFDSQFNFTPTADTQYILLPQTGSQIQGQHFCAYHNSSQPFFGANKEWSIIPYLADSAYSGGCVLPTSAGGSADVAYAMERVTTHEFAETVTNGFGNAWHTNEPGGYGGQEIGDLCNEIPDENQILPDTNLWVQYEWDNVTQGGGPGLSNCVRSIDPDAPPGVSATGGSNAATVSWSPASSDNGQPITGYGVTAYTASGQNAGTHWLSGSTLSTTFSHLSGGSDHFVVWAANVFGSGPYATSGTVTLGGLSVQPMTTGLTATALANTLAGTGVSASHATYSGARVAAGLFSGGQSTLDVDSGVVLSSGTAAAVVGPAQATAISTANGMPGDPQLGALVGFPTFDAAALAFDVVPANNTLSMTYVFGSSEYDFYAGSQYNDVMAVFVDGRNCALLPGGVPVSVNGVNLARNAGYFRNNDPSYGAGSINTALHGLTTVLRCVSPVTPGQTHHVKIVVSDASDEVLDSDVFVLSHSVSSP